ncbi:MAG: RNA ligase family protein [Candidatus Methanoperedens sp.]
MNEILAEAPHRKLATIQKIRSLSDHSNADTLELATVLGWPVIVKKCEFEVGDLCCYFEIDSVLPNIPSFEFLSSKKHRIKTIKLRGALSQGLAIPIRVLKQAILETDPQWYDHVERFAEGLDVTDILKVIKYEKPTKGSGFSAPKGMYKESFPSGLVPKTDEIRLQSIPAILEEAKGLDMYITHKLDGTSATYFFHKPTEQFGVCSRNMLIKPDETHFINNDKREGINNFYWEMAYKYNIAEILEKYHEETGKNIALQGEIVGPKIGSDAGINTMGVAERYFFIFNIWDIDAKQYFNWGDLLTWVMYVNRTMVNREIGRTFDVVPLDCIIHEFDKSLDELLEMAKGYYPYTKNIREGIVVRSMNNVHSNLLNWRMSFKVINNDYLLAEK